MTSVFSSGIIECFVGILQGVPVINPATGQVDPNINNRFTPTLLGAGRVPPEPETVPKYFGVKSDLSGQELNYDDGFAGAECMVTFEMTIWDSVVLETVASAFNLIGESDMQWIDTDIGTLMVTEGYAFPVWFRAGRRNVPAMQALGMAKGYRYMGNRLMRFQEKRGNKENSMLLVFHSRATRNKVNDTWTLRDRDMTAVLNLDGV